MSVDRTKLLEAAQKHLAKGNYDRAIAEYQRLVQADPSDVRTWLKIGDIYTRKGARKEAIDHYLRGAEIYRQQGHNTKALATCRQILRLDPARLDVQMMLGEIHEDLQLVSEALAAYEQVAAHHARAGNVEETLKTLARMAALTPENVPVRIKYAEALSKAGKTKEAADEFDAGAKLLKAQGRMDDYIKVSERLCFHRPNDMAAARELARLHLERNDPKRALPRLQVCFKTDPKDIPTLELLAEAFNQLQQLPKTISVYKEVARIHQEANRRDERARTLKKILELDPGDAEARQGLAAYAGSSPNVRRDIAPPASAVVEAGRVSEVPEMEVVASSGDEEDLDLDEDSDVEVIEDEADLESVESGEAEDTQEPVPVPAAARPATASVPPDVQREAQIARLLTECDVFLRYRLKGKVIELLRSVLEIEPRHVEARERLKDMFVEQQDTAAAVAELITLADILEESESAAAMLYLREALALDPNHAGAQERLAQINGEPMPTGDRTDDFGVVPSNAPEDEVVFFEDDTTQASDHETPAEEVPFAAPPPTVRRPALVPPADPEQAFAAPPPTAKLVVPPPSREAMLPSEPPEQEDLLAPMSPREFDEVPLRPSDVGEPPAEAPRRSIAPGAGEIEEILDEADFFIAQGLYDEARGTLREALNHHPDHPIVKDKLREVEDLAAQNRSSAPVGLDQSFELAERLAEDLDGEIEAVPAGSDVLDVEEVFAQFKKGVEQQVGLEDSETHFDLGIAYKEMGLLDDAMNEFRLCLTNPERVCIAQTMIGICHMEKGQVAEAISHFKKGLYADTKTDREELGLYFELGSAYEALHDPKEALYYYQKVQKRDPAFRDVGRRIQGITQPATPAAGPPSMALEEIDRAFDDLVGED